MMSRFLYHVVRCFLALVSCLPLKAHYFLSGIISWILQHLVSYRYATVITNLSRSFPELGYREIRKTASDFYHHLGEIIAEAVWAYGHSADKVGENVEIEGKEAIRQACSRNRNVIVMLGHIGNWEIFTSLPDLRKRYDLDLNNEDFVYVFKKPSSRTAALLIDNIRSRHHACSIIEDHKIFRQIAGEKEGKKLFYFICDQNPHKNESGTIVDFLNQKTYMIEGPEKIATRFGMPILYCGLLRPEKGKNVARFELITEDASRETPGKVTASFAEKLERDIRDNKKSWLWSHRRWKKQII